MLKRLKILNTVGEAFAGKGKSILSRLGNVVYGTPEQKTLKKIIGGYGVLIVQLGLRVDREVIDRAGRLKVIATATTGLDHIDVAYAASKGITVLSLKDETEFLRGVTSTAELAFLFILMLSRDVCGLVNSVKKSKWKKSL